jgi:hypothetical protein
MEEGQSGRRVRSAALERVARVKRWVVGGALALTGIFSAVAAHALPASHAKSRLPSPTPTTAAQDPQSTAIPQAPVPEIAPPAQVPQPSSSDSGAVSGGS